MEENTKSKGLKKESHQILESGDILNSVLACFYSEQYQKAGSLLYSHEYLKNLEKMDELHTLDECEENLPIDEDIPFVIDIATLKEAIQQISDTLLIQ